MGYPILLVVVDTVGPFGRHALIRASCNVSFDAEITNPEAKMSFVFGIVCNLDFMFYAGVSLLSWVKSEHISVWKGPESFFNEFAYGEQFKFGPSLEGPKRRCSRIINGNRINTGNLDRP